MRRAPTLALLFGTAIALFGQLTSGCSLLVSYDEIPTGQGGAAAAGGASAGPATGTGGANAGGGGAAPACVAPSDCPTFETDTVCRTTSCTDETCTVTLLPVDTPVDEQTAADCLVNVCDAGGEVVSQPDDTDVADDGNDCTDNLCSGGQPSHPNTAAGTPCGANNDLTCDGNGACTGCTLDSQCNADTDCQDHFCDTSVSECKVTIAADGVVCTSDNLFCTGVEVCQGGTCQSPGDPCPGADNDGDCSETCNEAANACSGNDPNGSNCDDGLYCNGADTCNGGTCSHAGSPCAGPDNDSNCAESCNESANNCSSNDPNGSSCQDDGQYCTGIESCQNGSCVGNGNPCAGPDGDSDCSETCNEAANNCNGNDPNGSACNDGLFCTTTDTCVNGNCSGSGDPCPGADGDGDCTESCNEAANNCSASDPNNSACNDGLYCTVTDTCSNGSCSGAGNPCPGADGDFDCSESCNEAANNCTANDTNGSACLSDGLFCTGVESCSNGACVSPGDPCPGEDFDNDCSEGCNEAANNCTANDPNGGPCGGGNCCFGGNCGGICP